MIRLISGAQQRSQCFDEGRLGRRIKRSQNDRLHLGHDLLQLGEAVSYFWCDPDQVSAGVLRIWLTLDQTLGFELPFVGGDVDGVAVDDGDHLDGSLIAVGHGRVTCVCCGS